jgi:HEAT repeat protein
VLLHLIWGMSLVVALGAILIMLLLVLIRLLSDRLDARRQAQRQAILENIFAWLAGAVPSETVRDHLAAQRPVATALLVEIFELVRGEDQHRLARLAEEAGLPQFMRDTVEIGTVQQRFIAAENLVWFPSDETRAVLRAALEDSDPEVALAAAGSLAELGEALPVRALLEARLDTVQDTSRQLEAVLARVAARQIPDLLEVAQDESAPERVRSAAIDALAQTGSFELLETIAAFAASPSTAIRVAAVRTLGIFGHPLGAPVVYYLLRDKDWEVRAEAAEAAGRIGLIDIAPRLCSLLSDENWWVRFRAGVALATLGPDGTERLKSLAAGPGDLAGRMAGLVLAERGLA